MIWRVRLMVSSSMHGLFQAGDGGRAADEAAVGRGKKRLRLLAA